MLEILLMESFALIFLSLSFLIRTEKIRLQKLLSALRKNAPSSVSSFSLTWAVGSRGKMIAVTPMFDLAVAFVTLGTGVVAFFVFFLAPKVSIVLVIGMAFLLNEEVLEALEYSRAVSKASLDSMNENDAKSIDLAITTLKSGIKRYAFYGLIFILSGVFILEIFEAVTYGVALIVGYLVPVSMQINYQLSTYLLLFFFVLALVFGGLIFQLVKKLLRRVYS